MAQDKWALENGKQDGDTDYGVLRFPAVKVDKILHDGDVVTLGDIGMTATLTAGHTKGCTTWSMNATDGGSMRRVIFPCSISVAGNILVGNKAYPNIVEDFRRSFKRLGAMQADVVLTAHPELADIFGRKAKRQAGDRDAFVDNGLLHRIVEKSRMAFEKELKASRK